MSKVEPMSTVNTPGLAPNAPKEEIPGKQQAQQTQQPDDPKLREKPAQHGQQQQQHQTPGSNTPAKAPPSKSP